MENYRVDRLPRDRLVVLDLLRLAERRHVVHGLLEADVTRARSLLNATPYPPTLTAFLVATLGRAIARHPEVNVRRAGRRLVAFDEVDAVVTVERELPSGRVPLPHAVRGVAERTVDDIADELAAVRRVPVSGAGDLASHRWVARVPSVVRRLGARAAARVPAAAARFGPPVALSSQGMFGPGWGIPVSARTLMVTVGGTSRRLVPVDGRATEREVLPLTLSFDHDVVDEAPAARFAATLRSLIEDATVLAPVPVPASVASNTLVAAASARR